MNKFSKQMGIQKGFTLIELLIVIAIIGILASIAITSYSSYIKKAKVSAARSDMVALSVVIENNYMKSLSYPGTTGAQSVASLDTWKPSSDEFTFTVEYEASDNKYTLKATGATGSSLAGCTLEYVNITGLADVPSTCEG